MLLKATFGVLSLVVMQFQGADVSAADPVQTENIPILRVRVEPDKGVADSSYRFVLSFTNTAKEAVTISQIELMLPDVIQSVRRDSSPTRLDPHQIVNPGNTRTIVMALPATKVTGPGPWLLPFTNYREMLTLPGKYPFRVLLSYQPDITSPAQQDIQAETDVFIDCTMASKLWGGVLGALLVGLYVVLYELKTEKGFSIPSFLRRIPKLLWMVSAGAVSAVILILILNRFQDIGLPINLKVNDFYGALVLGLFTYKLGDWLYGQLAQTTPGTTPS